MLRRGVQPGFAHSCFRVSGQPVVQLESQFCRVCLVGMPGVDAEAGGHAFGGCYAFPVAAGDGADVAAVGAGVVGVVIFHEWMMRPLARKLK